MSTTRAAGIRGFRDVVAELGGDADALARSVGLDPLVLDEDELPVPDVALGALLERAAAELACPDFGLRLAARHDLAMLGPLALLLAGEATGRRALATAQRYLRVHTSGLSLRVEPADGVAAIVLDGLAPRLPPQLADASIGFLHRAVSELLGPGLGLRSVTLPPGAPAEIVCYERWFGVPVATGEPAALLLDAATLDQPVTAPGSPLAELAAARLAAIVPAEGSLVDRVRALVVDVLPYGAPLPGVARALHLEPRTLQRHLAAEGTTYAAVVDATRATLARHLLAESDLALSDISARLGFSEQATLTRAARRWWGVPPSVVRSARRGGMPAQVVVQSQARGAVRRS